MTGRKLRKPFYPLDEVCQRLEMLPSDLEPFVLHGHLKLSIPAADFWVNVGAWIEVEEGNCVRSPEGTAIVRGLLDLIASDAWRVLRYGAAKVERFDADAGRYIEVWGGSEPFADHEVLKADLVVRDAEVSRFEAEHAPPAADTTNRGAPGQRGAMAKYDWDAFWREVARSVLFEGVPESQAAFVRRMVNWFDSRGQHPDLSTIKKKLSPLWREIAPEAERKIA